MVVGYDLGWYPVTFDLAHWLVRVEEARIKMGVQSLHILFQPGENDGFRLKTERDYKFTADRKQWRLENLLMPLARRLPSVSAVTATPERIDVETPHFDIFNKIFENPLSPLRASEIAKTAIRSMYPKRYATITIRQSDVQTERNSRQEEWAKVAKWLSKHGLNVVVVPDTEALLQGNKQQVWPTECIPAAMNVDLRLALYELAQFNCFSTGGPNVLAMLDDEVRYAVFGALVKGIPACSADHLTKIGLHDGSNRGPYRNCWWAEDRFENICPKLDEYLDIKYKVDVKDVLKAQTRYNGFLIKPVSPMGQVNEHSSVRNT